MGQVKTPAAAIEIFDLVRGGRIAIRPYIGIPS